MKNLIIAMLVMSILAITSVAAVPQFGAQINTSTDGSQVTITGTVIDATEGTNVQLFCSEKMVGEFPVIDGAFTATTVYGGINGCNAGIAVLKLGDVETSVNIPELFIIAPKGGQSKDAPFYSFGIQESNAQVPEFSILTLGIAVIGVGLGLALLRKQN
jgi:type 1 fimbria pilin